MAGKNLVDANGSPPDIAVGGPLPTRPPRTWRRRVLRSLLLYVLTPYLAVTLIFAALQRKFLYPATRADRLPATEARDDGLAVSDVEFPAANGVVLRGWHLRPLDGPPEDERLLILYFAGNAGNRGDRVHDFRECTRLGCDLLIFDYRGYGDSGGSPSEAALAVDARRAWV